MDVHGNMFSHELCKYFFWGGDYGGGEADTTFKMSWCQIPKKGMAAEHLNQLNEPVKAA